jgi:pimeloyl-ACP methyl ester carboxylesterase
MPEIDRDGRCALHHVDAGDGGPVVLLHGWGLANDVWDRQVRVLLENGRRVVAPDLRGHGRSPKPSGGYEVESLALDVIALLDALEISKVDLVGWSLGGLTAFALAARHPDRVNRLVLVGSNGVANTRKDGYPFGLRAEDQEETLVSGELDNRLSFRRVVIGDAFASAPDPSVLDWLVSLSLMAPSWVGAACLRTLLQTDNVWAAASIVPPVVQIVGAKDPVLSKRAASWLMETVPAGRQTILADAGHYPMLEAPAAFDAALLDALS